jgi:hypothetical protein
VASPPFDQEAALRVLAGWADDLSVADVPAGEWHRSEHDADGVWSMPWWEPSPRALAFIRDVAGAGWVTPEVDWMRWAPTGPAQRLRRDRQALAAASVDDLRHLLTTIIRSDRFFEGSLAEAFETGLLAAIAARARVLLEDA